MGVESTSINKLKPKLKFKSEKATPFNKKKSFDSISFFLVFKYFISNISNSVVIITEIELL